MFDRLPTARDARILIESEIEERRNRRRTDLVERLSGELRGCINARAFTHTFYAKVDLWDTMDAAATELNEIAQGLEKMGYGTVLTMNRDRPSASIQGRTSPAHNIKINW